MEAILRATPHRPPIRFRLDDACGLVSGVATANAFDSSVEELLSIEWGELSRDGWRMERETEILHRGQTAFFPDFVFVHQDGMRVMLEIVGFWTPEYLKYKAQVLKLFREQPVLLAIAQSLKEKFAMDLDLPTLYFKDTIKVEEILKSLHSLREFR